MAKPASFFPRVNSESLETVAAEIEGVQNRDLAEELSENENTEEDISGVDERAIWELKATQAVGEDLILWIREKF